MTSFKKNKILFILVHYSIVISFLLTAVLPSPSFAQTFSAPAHHLIALSPAFTPVILRGIKVYPDNPLKFDFIVDGGNTGLKGEALKPESEKLIKYFLASLTVPQDDLWVNLSPYEKDRIIPNALSQTDMGKDMLAQDYLLKQITASLIYPEGDTGKKFWEKIYKKAYEQFGTTNIPIDTFNKVWIMPEKAVVYEQEDKAFVVESRLKVMLEEDYLAMEKAHSSSLIVHSKTNELSATNHELTSRIVREVILPELENEVNSGKNFAQLRQIYNALILAYWFKAKLKTSILNKVYSDQSKVKGIDIAEKDIAQKIYGQYVNSFKQGVMNFIKVERDQYTNKNIPRKYFAGGVSWTVSSAIQYTSTISGSAPQWVSSPLSKAAVNMERFGSSFVSSSPAISENTNVEFKTFFEKTLLDYQGRTLCGADGFFQKLLGDGKYTPLEIARHFGNPGLERNFNFWIGNFTVPQKKTLEWIVRWLELENSGNLLDRFFSLRDEDLKRPREKLLADKETTPAPQAETNVISEDPLIEETIKPVETMDLSIKEEEISVSPQAEEIQSVPVIPQVKEKKPADPLTKVFMRTLLVSKVNRLCGKRQFYDQFFQDSGLVPVQFSIELGISENRLRKMIDGSAEFYVIDAVVAKTIERVGLSGEDLKAFLALRNQDKERSSSSSIGSSVGSSAILPENLDDVGIPKDYIRSVSAMSDLISFFKSVASKKAIQGDIFVLGTEGSIEPILKLIKEFPKKEIYVAEENPSYGALLRELKAVDENVQKRVHLILRDPSGLDGVIDDETMGAVFIDGELNWLSDDPQPEGYFNDVLNELNRILKKDGVLVADISLSDLVDKTTARLSEKGFKELNRVQKTHATLLAFEQSSISSSVLPVNEKLIKEARTILRHDLFKMLQKIVEDKILNSVDDLEEVLSSGYFWGEDNLEMRVRSYLDSELAKKWRWPIVLSDEDFANLIGADRVTVLFGEGRIKGRTSTNNVARSKVQEYLLTNYLSDPSWDEAKRQKAKNYLILVCVGGKINLSAKMAIVDDLLQERGTPRAINKKKQGRSSQKNETMSQADFGAFFVQFLSDGYKGRKLSGRDGFFFRLFAEGKLTTAQMASKFGGPKYENQLIAWFNGRRPKQETLQALVKDLNVPEPEKVLEQLLSLLEDERELFPGRDPSRSSSALGSSSSASSVGISSSRKVTIEQKLDHFVNDEKVDAKPYTYKELAEIFKVHRTSMVMRKDSILATFDEANKKRGITKGGFALNLQKHLSYQETETLLKRLLTYFIVQHPEISPGPVTIADISRITTMSKVTLALGRSIQARVRKKLDAVNKARGIPRDAPERFHLSIAAPNISTEAVTDRINQMFKKHLLDGALPVGPVSIPQVALLINVTPSTLWDNANHQVSIEQAIDEVNQELAISSEEKRYWLHRYNIKSREQVLAGIKAYENYLLRQDVSHKLNDVIPLFIKDIGERTGIVRHYFRQNGPYVQDVRAMLAKVNQSKGFISGKGYILFTDHKNGFSVMSENDFGPLYKEAFLEGQAADDLDMKAILSSLPSEDTQKMDAFAQIFRKVLHDYVISGNNKAHLLGPGQLFDVAAHAISRNNEFSYDQRAVQLGISPERFKKMINGTEDPLQAGLAVKRVVQKLKEYGFSESGRTIRLFLALAENERKLGGISSAVSGSENRSSSALGSEFSSISEKIITMAEAILKSPTDGLGKMALAFAKEKEDEKSKYFEGYGIKACFFGERGFVEYVREKLEETIGIQVADFDLATILNLSKEDMYREHRRNGLQQSRRKNILKKYSLKGKERECFERIATDFFKEKRISLAVNILKAELFGLLEETVQDKILDSSRPLGDVLLKGYFWGEDNLAERMRALVNEQLNPSDRHYAEISDPDFADLIGCDRTTVFMLMSKNKKDKRYVSRSDVVRKRVSVHLIDHYLSDPLWGKAKIKQAKDYLFLLLSGGEKNLSDKMRIVDELAGIKATLTQKNSNKAVVSKSGKAKSVSEAKFEELFLQVLFDTEINYLCGRSGFFFKLFAQGKFTTDQIAEHFGDLDLEDKLIDWMDGKAQPSQEILTAIVNKMDLPEPKKALVWLLFLRDKDDMDARDRSSPKSSSAIKSGKENKPEPIVIADPGGTLVTNYDTNVRFFMDYDHYYFNVGNIEMFPVERFLTFSEIDELVGLGYEKENIRKALADDFRTRKFSYLLKEDFDLGYLEDFTSMIGEKKKAPTAYKQIRIYQNGVGKEPKEFQGILEALLQAFKANSLTENDGRWHVEMILVDCDRDLLGNLFHSKEDMQYFLKRLPFHLDVHFIEGDMLDRERMEEIGEQYGKADYIFNRRTIYAQDAFKEGKLSLEALKLNAVNLKDSLNLRQRFLFEALKVYLATKNTVSYFSRPGTRYIIEANSSNDVFQLPGGRILHFGNDPAALRKNGTGIYEVLDPSLMAEKGLISFLKYNESQGKISSSVNNDSLLSSASSNIKRDTDIDEIQLAVLLGGHGGPLNFDDDEDNAWVAWRILWPSLEKSVKKEDKAYAESVYSYVQSLRDFLEAGYLSNWVTRGYYQLMMKGENYGEWISEQKEFFSPKLLLSEDFDVCKENLRAYVQNHFKKLISRGDELVQLIKENKFADARDGYPEENRQAWESISTIAKKWRGYFVAMNLFLSKDLKNDIVPYLTKVDINQWFLEQAEKRTWDSKGNKYKVPPYDIGKPVDGSWPLEWLHLAIERLVSNGYHAIDAQKEELPDELEHVDLFIEQDDALTQRKAIKLVVENPGAISEESLVMDQKTGLPKIFSLDPYRGGRKWGSGLGLPFAVATIRKLGGTIIVENIIKTVDGKQIPYTHFEIILPVDATKAFSSAVEKKDASAATFTWQDFVPNGIKENPPWANDPDYQKFTNPYFGGLGFHPSSIKVRKLQIEEEHGLEVKKNGVGLVLGLSNRGVGAIELEEIYEQFKLKQIHGVDWVGDRVRGIAENILKKGYSPEQFLLYHADMNDLKGEIPSASIDLVYVTNVGLFGIDISQDFIKEIIRVLAPGGIASFVARLDFEKEELFNKAGKIFSSGNRNLIVYFRKNASSSLSIPEPIEIAPLLNTHGAMSDEIKKIFKETGKSALVFNFDAHKDDSRIPWHRDGAWARTVERKGQAVVIQMPSYFEQKTAKRVSTNWNTDEYKKFILEAYAKAKDRVGKVLVSIDYDFFSLSDADIFSGQKEPIYDLDVDQIKEELQAATEFFKENNIVVTHVFPSIPSNTLEYYNLQGKRTNEEFENTVTALIHEAYDALSEDQIKKTSPAQGSSSIGIDKTYLVKVFPERDYLLYLILHVTGGGGRAEGEDPMIEKSLESLRDTLNRGLRKISLEDKEVSAKSVKDFYLKYAKLLKDSFPKVTLLSCKIKDDDRRAITTKGISDAKNFVASIEMLFDESYKEVNVDDTFKKMLKMTFSNYWRYRAYEHAVKRELLTDNLTIAARQDEIAYLFLSLILPVRSIEKAAIDVSSEAVSDANGKNYAVITLETSHEIPQGEAVNYFSRKKENAEIGLDIAKAIAKKYEIEMTVEPGVDEGRKIILRIPAIGAVVNFDAMRAALKQTSFPDAVKEFTATEHEQEVWKALEDFLSNDKKSFFDYSLAQGSQLTKLTSKTFDKLRVKSQKYLDDKRKTMIRWAMALHDIAKDRGMDGLHAVEGARIAREILERIGDREGLSKADVDDIVWLIENHDAFGNIHTGERAPHYLMELTKGLSAEARERRLAFLQIANLCDLRGTSQGEKFGVFCTDEAVSFWLGLSNEKEINDKDSQVYDFRLERWTWEANSARNFTRKQELARFIDQSPESKKIKEYFGPKIDYITSGLYLIIELAPKELVGLMERIVAAIPEISGNVQVDFNKAYRKGEDVSELMLKNIKNILSGRSNATLPIMYHDGIVTVDTKSLSSSAVNATPKGPFVGPQAISRQAIEDIVALQKYFPEQLFGMQDESQASAWLDSWLKENKLYEERVNVMVVKDGKAIIIGGLDRKLVDHFKLPYMSVVGLFMMSKDEAVATRRSMFKRGGGQLTFPGGYGKNGMTAEESTLEELQQELGLGNVPLDPKCLELVKIVYQPQLSLEVAFIFQYNAVGEEKIRMANVIEAFNKEKEKYTQSEYEAHLKRINSENPGMGLGETSGMFILPVGDIVGTEKVVVKEPYKDTSALQNAEISPVLQLFSQLDKLEGLTLESSSTINATPKGPFVGPQAISLTETHEWIVYWLYDLIEKKVLPAGLPIIVYDFHNDAESTEGRLGCGNWITIAKSLGLISQVILVRPNFSLKPEYQEYKTKAEKLGAVDYITTVYGYSQIPEIKGPAIVSIDFDFISLQQDDFKAHNPSSKKEIDEIAKGMIDALVAKEIDIAAINYTPSSNSGFFQYSNPMHKTSIEQALRQQFARYQKTMFDSPMVGTKNLDSSWIVKNALEIKDKIDVLFKNNNAKPSSSSVSDSFIDYVVPQGVGIDTATGRIWFDKKSAFPSVQLNFDLWYVRHGETFGNAKGIFQGALDEEMNQLNDKGQEQAGQAAERLWEQLKEKIEAGEEIIILTSELTRAQKTAKAFIDLVKLKTGKELKAIIDPLVNEVRFGFWDNKTMEEIMAQSKKETAAASRYRNEFDATVHAEGGESFLNLVARVQEVLTIFNKRYEGKTVVIFGHGSWAQALRVLLGDEEISDENGKIQWRNILPNAMPKLFAASSAVNKIPGGIDMKRTDSVIEVKGEGKSGSWFGVGGSSDENRTTINDSQFLLDSNFQGFVPVIIDIVPVINIFQTMGMNAEEEQKIRQAMEREPLKEPEQLVHS